ALPLYLALIAWRPRRLARLALLAPLFAAGAGGSARIAAARALHLGVLVAGHWAAMRLFGIVVPAAAALAGLPVMFLIAALPISPAGLGTTQAAAMTLFAGFAPGADEATRQAVVIAYSLAFHAAGTAMVAAVGMMCLRRALGPVPGSLPTRVSRS